MDCFSPIRVETPNQQDSYAVAEWTEKLALAFAQHRRWPENTLVQAECLLTAASLAHYAQDLCQPLHTSVHFDGRALEGGKSPRSGIHEKKSSSMKYSIGVLKIKLRINKWNI